MSTTDTEPNETYMLEVDQDGDDIRDLAFVTSTGERWPAFTPHAEIYEREDGAGWMIGWGNGAAGPVASRQFAEQVAETMREGIIERAKPLLS
jgi:hypothetical protein